MESGFSLDAKTNAVAQLERLYAIAWSVQHGTRVPPSERVTLFEPVDLFHTVRHLVRLWLPDVRDITDAEAARLRDQSLVAVSPQFFSDEAVVLYWPGAAHVADSASVHTLWNERLAGLRGWCRLVGPYVVIVVRDIAPGDDDLIDLVHHLQAFVAALRPSNDTFSDRGPRA